MLKHYPLWLIIMVLLVIQGCQSEQSEQNDETTNQANFLLIVVDDQGYADMSTIGRLRGCGNSQPGPAGRPECTVYPGLRYVSHLQSVKGGHHYRILPPALGYLVVRRSRHSQRQLPDHSGIIEAKRV